MASVKPEFVHKKNIIPSDWLFCCWKRALDLSLAAILLVGVCTWLMPLTALAIRIGSPGPVFFMQKRVGRYGRNFICYKFRSMYVNAESDIKQAAADDARITGLGALLRRTHIDELPQLFNILLGHMSFIGPRPHMLQEDKAFDACVTGYHLRRLARPGLSGLAQVKGYHGYAKDLKSIEDRTRLDLFYLNKASFLLDISILFHTLRKPFKKRSTWSR